MGLKEKHQSQRPTRTFEEGQRWKFIGRRECRYCVVKRGKDTAVEKRTRRETSIQAGNLFTRT